MSSVTAQPPAATLAPTPGPGHTPRPATEEFLATVEGRYWLALHFPWSGSRNDLILDHLWPLVTELLSEGLIDRFFFIRYGEEGPHVRLRLRLAAGVDRGHAEVLLGRGRRAVEKGDMTVAEPHPFELETERYGGPDLFPASLEYFALSSLDTVDFLEGFGHQMRDRQMPSILSRLLWQACGLAGDCAELRRLLDYYSDFSGRFAAVVERADAVFEKNAQVLRARFEHDLEQVLEGPGLSAAWRLFEGAFALSRAIEGANDQQRRSILASQMHMSSNRLGLRNPEETYATRLLSRMAMAGELEAWWQKLEHLRGAGGDMANARVPALDELFELRLQRLLEASR